MSDEARAEVMRIEEHNLQGTVIGYSANEVEEACREAIEEYFGDRDDIYVVIDVEPVEAIDLRGANRRPDGILDIAWVEGKFYAQAFS